MPRGVNNGERRSEIKIIRPSWSEKIRSFITDTRLRLVLAVVLFAVGLCLTIAYCSYFFTGKEDYSILQLPAAEQHRHLGDVQNLLGLPGAKISHFLIDQTFGVFSVCILLIIYGLTLLCLPVKHDRFPYGRYLLINLFGLIYGSVVVGFIQQIIELDMFFRLGGRIGMQMAVFLLEYVKIIGASVILIAVCVIFFILIDKNFLDRLKSWWRSLKEVKGKLKTIQEAPNEKKEEGEVSLTVFEESKSEADGVDLVIEQPQEEMPAFGKQEEEGALKGEEGSPLYEKGGEPASPNHPAEPLDEEEKELGIERPKDVELVDERIEDLSTMLPYDPRKDLEFYNFPALDLLKVYDNETTPVIDPTEQRNNAQRIVTALRNYGVEIESIKATVGPTVTLYEVVPKAGVKISKIQALEADIMLSLSAVGIRIIAPMPGKGTVGIEVPNENPQVVSMHSVIASKKFQEEQKMRLPVAIGRTITNEVFMFDLAKTPHLLVAGATGQGKSVGLNAIITSLLYKKHPSELKLVLVDPKMVEFSIYQPLIKHYLAGMPDQSDRDIIITDCQKVINTLNSLVIEMEDRYTLLADANCRNLEDYNDKFIKRHIVPGKEVENSVMHKMVQHNYLPYLVIVIDEYGDFIMQAGKEVERPIQRLAQKARAVGMHMILATQRPDVKIITGTIKANIPTRIAFRTQSVVDSRTVLDAKGADRLIGKGDMLYSGGGNLTRIQCAFVDTPEVEAIVEHIKTQQGFTNFHLLPEYTPEGGGNNGVGEEMDSTHFDVMFEEVARYVVEKQEGSTSRLQRAFEIGYNRAGKLSDQLERAGIVGPNKGSKGRDVLIQDMESLERILAQIKK